MGRFLPRFARHGWFGSFSVDFTGEFEGVEFSVTWLGFYLSFTLARRWKP